MKNEQQSIEELNQRYLDLNEKRIQTQTRLEEARQRLEILRSEARETFGTDDVDKLEQMLKSMNEENEKMRAEYQSKLDSIEKNLVKVETEFQTTDR